MADESSSSLFIGRVMVDSQTRDKYVLQKKIGTAPAAAVFRAQYLPNENANGGRVAPETTFVALKVTRNDSRARVQLDEAIERNSRMGLRRHPNIVGFKNSFVDGGLFCIVMDYMDEGSLSYIVSKRFKNGMPEDCIAIALREAAVRGLLVIHYSRGDLAFHRNFSADNIFVHKNPTAIKLATQVTSYKHEPSGESSQGFDRLLDEFPASSAVALSDYPSWIAAPEVYNSKSKGHYTKAADIWLVGVTALELAYGGLHTIDREGFDAIIAKITEKKKLPTREKFVGLGLSKGRKVLHKLGMKLKGVKSSKDKEKPVFSEEFEKMVLMCLDLAPEKRPTVDDLRRCEFVRKHLPKGMRYFRELALL